MPPQTLTSEQLASLLTVGNSRANEPSPAIPAEHSARLIAMGYMADISGRLRMTTPGRIRISLVNSPTDGLKGLNMMPKIKEHTCPACNGTGFPVVMQPVLPGRKIYPVKCKSCDGKGKITATN